MNVAFISKLYDRHGFAFLFKVYLATSNTVICSSELFIVLEPLNRAILIEKRSKLLKVSLLYITFFDMILPKHKLCKYVSVSLLVNRVKRSLPVLKIIIC